MESELRGEGFEASSVLACGDPATEIVTLELNLSCPNVEAPAESAVGLSMQGLVGCIGAAVAAGPLPKEMFEGIRARWREVAQPTWVGQT